MYSRYYCETIYNMIIGLHKEFHILPPDHQVDFNFTKCEMAFGWVTEEDNEWYIIEISKVKNKNLQDLIGTIAHEMIHMYEMRKHPTEYHKDDYLQHGKLFNKVREQLEEKLGFDIS